MEKELIEKPRHQYIQNPPEGMTPKDIQDMDDNDLLNMDYFLYEDDDLMMILESLKISFNVRSFHDI